MRMGGLPRHSDEGALTVPELTPVIASASPFYWIPFAFLFIALFFALWGALREDRGSLDEVEEREQ